MTQTEALKLALEALEDPLAPTKRLKAITAIKKALAQQCVCGEPNSAGTHRTDGPCLAPQPEYQSTAEKSKLEKIPAKGTLLAHPEQDILKIGCVNHDCDKCKAQPEQEKNLLKRVISWMEKVSDSTPENTDDEGIALVKDIYKALAQPEQEPVAWMYPDALCDKACLYLCTKGFTQFPECANTPPQRTWVGLTDEEIDKYFDEQWVGYSSYHDCFKEAMCWQEAKLKEKNT